MEPPYENCVEGSEQIAECLHRCNSRRSQILCQCTEVMAGSHEKMFTLQSISNKSDSRNDTELAEFPDCDVMGQLCILKMNGKLLFIYLNY